MDRPSRRFQLERLESRVLFSADSALLTGALGTYLDSSIDLNRIADTLPASEQNVQAERLELVFIDRSVPELDALLTSLGYGTDPQARIHLITTGSDGIEQMTRVIEAHQNISAVHLISHGSDGEVFIGGESLNTAALLANADTLAGWADNLSLDADLLIYGCDLAASDQGRMFVDTLAALTGADVAASDDVTGHAALGGDWDLEYETGEIDTLVAVDQPLQDDWQGSLARVVYGSTENSNDDVLVKNGEPSGQVFSFSSGNGTYVLNEVDLFMRREPDAPSQTLTITIQDSWNGIVLGTDTLSSTSLNTSFAWETFSFSDIELDDGTSYVIQITTSSGGEKIRISGDKDNGYAPGDRILKDGSIDSDKDLTFRIAWSDASLVETTSNVIQDAYVDADFPNNKYGSSSTLVLNREDNGIAQALLQFDVSTIPLNATILAAYVDLEIDTLGGDLEMEAREVLESWNESNVTWNQRNTGSSWSASNGPTYGSSIYGQQLVNQNKTGTLSFDITALAAGWHSGANNNGVLIGSFEGGGDREAVFDSREGSVAPVLRVIYVLPPNTDPVITSPATYAIDENTTGVGTITATDSDGDTPTYSIVGGADNGFFSINTVTGALTISARNFESPADANTDNVYEVAVQADDGNGGFDTKAIQVTIGDANDSPLITSNPSGSVVENTTTVGTVTVFDADGDTINYTLLGTDASHFSIDSGGNLTFTVPPDFESPADNGADNVYNLLVTASDGPSDDTQAVVVTVTDANDAPIISSANSFNVDEGTTAVGTITSNDEDAGATAAYSIVAGNDGGLFSINSTTGALSFTAAPDFETPTDGDTNNVYALTVQVDDGTGAPNATATQLISVTVQDLADEALAPITDIDGTANSVDENSAIGTSVGIEANTTDGDAGQTITYSLSSNPGNLFAIDGSSGVVTTAAVLDHETSDSHTIEVTATSSDGSVRAQSFVIAVGDVNEAPTFTSTEVTTATEDSAYSYSITSTDVDAADSLTVTATTLPGWLTLTDGGTGDGSATLSGTPTNAEVGDHSVVLVVTDGGSLTDTQSFTITVNNANDAPVIDSANAFDVDENTTAVGTVTSTDDDAGSSASYSIVAGNDGGLFSINSSSGALSFSAAPDFEAPTDGNTDNVYVLTVQVDDGTGAPNATATQLISVTVQDLADEALAPISDTDVSAETVDENLSAGVTVGLTANTTDGDAGQTITYSLSNDAGGRFSIDGITGVVTTAAVLDHETSDSHAIEVTATSSDGSVRAQSFVIAVGDVNEAPLFTSTEVTAATEDSAYSYSITSSDVDDGDSLVVSASTLPSWLTLTDGGTGDGSATLSGTPTNADVGDHSVVLVVTDGGSLTDTQSFTITVTNTNDAPAIDSANAFDVDENTTAVGTVTSTDDDAGASASYSIVAGNDGGLFSINSSSGALSFSAAPDFEAPADGNTDNVYVLTVQVDDGTGAPNATATQLISVTVQDLADEALAPITDTDVSAETVDENLSAGVTVGLTANTTDGDAGQTITYSLSSNPGNLFAIDGSSGVVTTAAVLDHETSDSHTIEVTATSSDGSVRAQSFVIAVGDVNEAPVFSSTEVTAATEDSAYSYSITSSDVDDGDSLVVTATTLPSWLTLTDGGTGDGSATLSGTPTNAEVGDHSVVLVVTDGGSLTDTQSFTITVNNANDAPVIDSANAFDVDENTTAVGTVTSTDDDAGSSASYSIVAGNDGGLFSINSSSGALSFSAAPDFEAPADGNTDNVYVLTVQVDDGTGAPNATATQLISVTVQDLADEALAPITDTDVSAETVDENLSAGVTVGLTANTTDGDAGQTITYSLSSNPGNLFAIDGSSGVVTTAAVLDHETSDSHTIEVTATSSDGSVRAQSFVIAVGDVNEAPLFTSTEVTAATEDSAYSYSITSSDVDDGDSLVVSASTLPSWLTLTDGGTGDGSATLSGTPTNADVGDHSVVLVVTDGGSLTDTQSFTITVTNTNDAPAIDSANAFDVDENTTAVGTVTSTDDDAGSSASYSIVAGNDGGLFSINSSSGALSFSAAPDFEAPTDGNTDNVYALTVQVDDGTGAPNATATQLISVTVQDLADEALAPISDTDVSAETVDENLPAGATVGLTANTTDGDAGQTITYSLSSNPGNLFAIDGSSGVVTTAAVLDHETSDSHTIEVTATSSDGSVRAQSFVIAVGDVNEAPLFTSTEVTTATEDSAYSYSITSTDVDAADSLTVTATTLPGWLTLTDGGTGDGSATLSGTPTNADVGDHSVVLVVTDGGSLTDTQSFTITVTNTNDAPLITSASAFDVDENTTAVGTVTSTDDDAGSSATYSIVAGNDGGLFSINAGTGALAFSAAPDFETPTDGNTDNVYVLTVQVDDGTGAPNATATQVISVTVQDLADEALAPISDIDAAAGSGGAVDENSIIGSSVGIEADTTDGDAGQSITYSLSNDAGGRFSIDGASGVVTTAAVLDHETSDSHTIEVTATSSDGSVRAQSFVIAVGDVNEAPTFTSTEVTGATEDTAYLYSITSSDIDDGDTLTVTATTLPTWLTLTDGGTGDGSATLSGTPTNADVGDHSVVLVVTDGGSLTDTQSFTITVNNANDAPAIDSANAFDVDENTTAVGTVTSTDDDAGASASYSIVAGNDGGLFSINSSSGALSFSAAPDFEAPTDGNTDNVYVLTVQVDDGTGAPNATATQVISVTVQDLADEALAPISDTDVSAETVDENLSAGATVGLTANTTDGDAGQTITYSLSSNPGNLFAIDGSSGVVTTAAVLDHETSDSHTIEITATSSDGSVRAQSFVIAVGDVNEAPTFTSTEVTGATEDTAYLYSITSSDIDDGDTLTVTATTLPSWLTLTDGGTGDGSATLSGTPTNADVGDHSVVLVVTDGGSLTDTQSFTITVTNTNDAPAIDSANAFDVDENTTAVGTVTSTDDDAGASASYSIVAGNDGGLFSINSTTGALSFTAAPDFETPTDGDTNNVYALTVQVDDGTGAPNATATQVVSVTVQDLADEGLAPISDTDVSAETVDENLSAGVTVGLTANTTDGDAGQSITYSLSSNPGNLFAIDGSSGVVTTAAVLDHETSDSHTIEVTATSSDGSVRAQSFVIAVGDVNEAPTFTSTEVTGATEDTAYLYSITSSDIDDGDTLTVTATTLPTWLTLTDSGTGDGSATLSGTPTNADVGDHSVVLVVTDGGSLTDTQSFTITVNNANDAPAIDSANAFDVDENTTAVGTVTSTDDDAGATAAYSIVAGNDGGLLSINSTTGALSFAAAPDFETPTDSDTNNVYVLTVQVDDGTGTPNATATQVINVTVQDRPDEALAPITDIDAAAGSGGAVDENSIIGSSVGIEADSTDGDAGQTITYSLSSNPGNLFAIDGSSGVVTTAAVLDHETSDSHTIEVTATSSDGSVRAQSFVIAVGDVNEAPLFTSTEVTTATEDSAYSYSITSTDVDAADSLTVTATTLPGWLTLTDGGTGDGSATLSGTPTNAEVGDHSVVLVVTDGGSLTDTQSFTITVTNTNDAPLITSASAFDVDENTTAVGTVTSTDDDAGSSATYSIVAGNDGGLFSINAGTGALAFSAAPDFEAPADGNTDNVYVLTVQVDDGTGAPNATATQLISVTVQDLADEALAPISDIDAAAGSGGAVDENSIIGSSVGIEADTTDGDAGQSITYSLSNDAGGRFSIDGASGVVTTAAVLDHETSDSHTIEVTATSSDGSVRAQSFVIAVGDVNEAPTFTSTEVTGATEDTAYLYSITSSDIDDGDTLTVTATTLPSWLTLTDGGTGDGSATLSGTPTNADVGDHSVVLVVTDGGSLTDTQSFTITVNNANDAPAIDSANAFDVDENTTAVGTVTSTDDDAGASASYSIVAGNDGGLFSINSSSGALSFSAAPDFEAPADGNTDNVYVLTVQVDDGTGAPNATATQVISVTVQDLADEALAPISDTDVSAETVDENLSAGATVGLTANTTDGDAGQTITYSLSSNPGNLFAIDGSSGVVTTAAVLDHETSDSHTIEVTATSSDGSVRAQSFVIAVGDVNEAPTFTSTEVTGATEDTAYLYSITSSDIDDGDTLTVTATTLPTWLTLTDGGTGDGSATLSGTPTNAEVGDHSVVLVVTDGGSLTDTQSFTITVANTNDAPAIDSANAFDVDENTTAVGTVTSTDDDAGSSASYSIVAGDDGGLFSINSTTGALSFTAAPDFETPTDGDTNNVYALTVQVDDGTGAPNATATQVISVTVQDLADEALAPISDTDVSAETVDENLSAGATVGLTANTTDGDAGQSITYSLSSNPGNLFAIDGSSGVVTTAAVLDHETSDSHTIEVTATSSDGSVRAQSFVIAVGDVNEAPLFTSTEVTAATEDSAYSYSITSSDVDDGDSLVVSASTLPSWLTLTDGGTGDGSATLSGTPTNADVGDHSVVLVVTDGGSLTDTQSFTITVTNTNDAPVIDSANAFDVDENTTAVGTVTSTDDDAGATAAYSIVAGNDGGLFSINSATGALSFAAAPDFETPTDSDTNNVYVLTVQVDDGTGAPNATATQVINVTVQDLADEALAPITDIDGTANSVDENSAIGTSVGIEADTTDGDAGQTITYSLSNDAGGRFSIDGNTGVVTTAAALDHETSDSHTIEITATSSDGSVRAQSFVIAVGDVNEAPVFSSTEVTTATEDSAYSYSITSSDVDDGDSLVVTATTLPSWLTLTDGGTGDGSATLSGTPTNADVGDHSVVLVVTDGGSLTDTQSFTITVTNTNDAPLITSASAFDVDENTTAVGTVTSTDDDAGSSATYSIVAGNDGGLFSINAGTGALAFSAAPDFETPTDGDTNNVYALTVQVDDGTGAPNATATQVISVTVQDLADEALAPISDTDVSAETVDENLPAGATVGLTANTTDGDAGQSITYSLTSNPGSLFAIDPNTGVVTTAAALDHETDASHTIEVTTTSSDGSIRAQSFVIAVGDVNEAPTIDSVPSGNHLENTIAVGTVVASDPDGDTLTFALAGPDADWFTIDTNGNLSFKLAPNFERPVDSDRDNTYVLQVFAVDAAEVATSQTISLTIVDAIEAEPGLIDADSAENRIAENQPAGSAVGLTGRVINAESDDRFTYSLAGPASVAFSIDPMTGVVTTRSSLDHELASVLALTVIAESADGQRYADDFTIRVMNVNEAPSLVEQVFVVASPSEGTVGVLQAIDPDQGDTASYTLVENQNSALFAIDPDSGELASTQALNSGTYELLVQLTDESGETSVSLVTVNILNDGKQPDNPSTVFTPIPAAPTIEQAPSWVPIKPAEGSASPTEIDGATSSMATTGEDSSDADTPAFPTDAEQNNQLPLSARSFSAADRVTHGTVAASAETTALHALIEKLVSLAAALPEAADDSPQDQFPDFTRAGLFYESLTRLASELEARDASDEATEQQIRTLTVAGSSLLSLVFIRYLLQSGFLATASSLAGALWASFDPIPVASEPDDDPPARDADKDA